MNEPTFKLVLETIISISPFLVLVFLWAYIKQCAGSSFSVSNRIFTFISGKPDFHDEKIKTFNDERQDIERFNVAYKLKATSKTDIDKFINWINLHSIDLSKISGLKGHFDVEMLRVKPVGRVSYCGVILLLLSLIFGVFFLLNISASNSALLSFKADGIWIWVNEEEASEYKLLPFSKPTWVLNNELCINDKFDLDSTIQISNLNETSIKSLCEFFKLKEDLKFVQSTITKQKVLWFYTLFVTLICINLFSLLMLYCRASDAVRHIQKRIR